MSDFYIRIAKFFAKSILYIFTCFFFYKRIARVASKRFKILLTLWRDAATMIIWNQSENV